MKRVISLVLLICLLSIPAVAGPFIWTETKTLYSSVTGTTGEVASSNSNFQHPVRSIGCDVSSSPTTTVSVRIEGQQGYLASFPSSSTAMAIISQTTNSTDAAFYVSGTDKPVSVIRAVVTTPTVSTSTVTVTCTGMQ